MAAVEAAIRGEVKAEDPGEFATDEDEQTLHRVLRLRARLIEEADRIEENAKALVGQLRKRVDGIDQFYGPLLADITRRKLQGKKAKSIKTPFGVAGFRAQPAKLVITDESKLPSQFIRTITQHHPDRAALDDAFKTTGEVPGGCDVEPAVEKFYIK